MAILLLALLLGSVSGMRMYVPGSRGGSSSGYRSKHNRGFGQSCSDNGDCIADLHCYPDKCQLAYGGGQWYNGWCEKRSGEDANDETVDLGRGHTLDTCLQDCTKEDYTACEWNKKFKACYRHTGKITSANNNGKYRCYIKKTGYGYLEAEVGKSSQSMTCAECSVEMLDSGICEAVQTYFDTRQGNLAHIITAHLPEKCGHLQDCGGRQALIRSICDLHMSASELGEDDEEALAGVANECPKGHPYAYRPNHGYDFCCKVITDSSGRSRKDGGDVSNCAGDQYVKCPGGRGCVDSQSLAVDGCSNHEDCGAESYCAFTSSYSKKCEPLEKCCDSLNAVTGVCPKEADCKYCNVQVDDLGDGRGFSGGAKSYTQYYYWPLGMNQALPGRPDGEGANSYPFEVARKKCAGNRNCGGITCNVNGQGFDKCEMRASGRPVQSTARDCQHCMSFKRKSGLCKQASPNYDPWAAENSLAFEADKSSPRNIVVTGLAVIGFAASTYGAARFYMGK